MPRPKISQSEHIRRVLAEKGIDYSPAQIVADLRKKGVNTNAELVHQVKSKMRSIAPEVAPKVTQPPLGDFITNALRGQGILVTSAIAHVVGKAGYKSEAKDLEKAVNLQCCRMEKAGLLKRCEQAGAVGFSLIETTPAQPDTKLLAPITTDDIANLVKVQRFMHDIGGPQQLLTYMDTLAKLERMPAAEVLQHISHQQTGNTQVVAGK